MLIINALKKINGNITDAAREIGLTRQALYRRVEKYGIRVMFIHTRSGMIYVEYLKA